MTCTDGRKYAVKFYNDGDKTVINEFICNRIARLLGLPVPSGELTEVDDGILNTINNNRNPKIKTGVHFGILFLEPSSNLQPQNVATTGVQRIINKDQVPGIILFDI